MAGFFHARRFCITKLLFTFTKHDPPGPVVIFDNAPRRAATGRRGTFSHYNTRPAICQDFFRKNFFKKNNPKTLDTTARRCYTDNVAREQCPAKSALGKNLKKV
jgi:hypothetical protein